MIGELGVAHFQLGLRNKYLDTNDDIHCKRCVQPGEGRQDHHQELDNQAKGDSTTDASQKHKDTGNMYENGVNLYLYDLNFETNCPFYFE